MRAHLVDVMWRSQVRGRVWAKDRNSEKIRDLTSTSEWAEKPKRPTVPDITLPRALQKASSTRSPFYLNGFRTTRRCRCPRSRCELRQSQWLQLDFLHVCLRRCSVRRALGVSRWRVMYLEDGASSRGTRSPCRLLSQWLVALDTLDSSVGGRGPAKQFLGTSITS